MIIRVLNPSHAEKYSGDIYWAAARRQMRLAINSVESVLADNDEQMRFFSGMKMLAEKVKMAGSSRILFEGEDSRVIDIPEEEERKGPTAPTDPMAIPDTWEQIVAHIKDGTYRKRYAIGQTRELVFDDQYDNMVMQIVAFDQDDLSDGKGKAAITFMSRDPLPVPLPMNAKKNKKCQSWKESTLREFVASNLRRHMHPFISAHIKPVRKCTAVIPTLSDEARKTYETEEIVWIPSHEDIFGISNSRQYPYYESLSSRKKLDDKGKDSWWWLSSSQGGLFFAVDERGMKKLKDPEKEGYVMFGFCL